jgi:acyl-CoA synthetase (NDP forming)
LPHPLDRLFDPRGVAVVGASETPGKYGYVLLKTLIEEGYPGAIHPVNPRGGSLLGRTFLRSLDEVAGPVDVALVVRPSAECLPAIRDVSRRGVPFAIVYAAGFAETGEHGRRLEREMVEAAAASGTRLVGPNGMNVFSAPARLNLSGIVPFPTGGLGFLSASGNLGYALAQEASRRSGLGFSRFISAGNQADLALDDYLDFLRTDPHTRVVLVYAEGFVPGRARAFLDGLAATAAEKPVVVLRGGRTRAGGRAAGSHTGVLAGESEVARQVLEQAGAVLIDRADEALDVAQGLLESPLPAGPRVALVGEGGGHATLLTDAVVEAGLLPEPFPDTLRETLRPHLPPFVAIEKNPLELGGLSEYDAGIYRKVLGPVLEWAGSDLVILFGGYALYDEATAAFLARRRAETGKPILLHDLYADEDRPALELVRKRGLPIFASVERAASAAGALVRARCGRDRARAATRLPTSVPTGPLPEEMSVAIHGAARRPDRALLEDEASRLVAHFGVPVLPAALARDADEAVRAAETLGYPVVLKVHAPGFLHKTDVGGVHLDLRSAAEVRRAFEGLPLASPDGRREARLAPFRPGGLEVIAGAHRDPQFGPIVLCGAGGVLAEIARDTAIRALPCPDAELVAMTAQTRVGALLEGARGRAPTDPAAVTAVLRALARLILAVPEVTDVEINPLRCGPEGAVALDARVLVAPRS